MAQMPSYPNQVPRQPPTYFPAPGQYPPPPGPPQGYPYPPPPGLYPGYPYGYAQSGQYPSYPPPHTTSTTQPPTSPWPAAQHPAPQYPGPVADDTASIAPPSYASHANPPVPTSTYEKVKPATSPTSPTPNSAPSSGSSSAVNPRLYGGPPPKTIWYMGIEIADPNAPAAGIDDIKVPGFDPKPYYERFNQLKIDFITNEGNESELIEAFMQLSFVERDAINDYCKAKLGRDLWLWFDTYVMTPEIREMIRALCLGPLMYDVDLLGKALQGIGTNEMILTEILLNRSPEDIQLLMEGYKTRYNKSLLDAVKSDLSGKLEKLFVMALSTRRAPDYEPIVVALVESDVETLVKAGKKKDEQSFFEIFMNRSYPHLSAVIEAFNRKYKSLSKVIKKAFSRHLETALLHIVQGLKPNRDGRGIWRDAKYIEKTMSGLGTRNSTLLYRMVRAQWDSPRMELVKEAYKAKYKRSLEERIRSDTSGQFKAALIMLSNSLEITRRRAGQLDYC